MKHYCEMNESDLKFHFDPPPPENKKKPHKNGVFWTKFTVLI